MAELPSDPWAITAIREIKTGVTSVTSLAADPTYVYVAENGQIDRVRRDDGELNVFAKTAGSALAIVLDDAGIVYWTEVGKVRSLAAAKPGDPPADVALGQNGPTGIAVYGDQVFWTNIGDGTVRRAPKSGGPAALVSGMESEPAAIAIDGSGVYWTNRGDGRVRAVLLSAP